MPQQAPPQELTAKAAKHAKEPRQRSATGRRPLPRLSECLQSAARFACLACFAVDYSYRSASTGGRFAARRAGRYPATRPTDPDAAMAMRIDRLEIGRLMSAGRNDRMTTMAATAIVTPPRAPNPLITPASIRNWARIARRRAPTTFLTPIP